MADRPASVCGAAVVSGCPGRELEERARKLRAEL